MPRSIAPEDCNPDPQWLMPEAMWKRIEPLLPAETPTGKGTKGGRPAADRRRTLDAIFSVLRTGGQWKALPRSLGSGSTAHAYFQRLVGLGVFEQLWRVALAEYDKAKGIQWQWQALDGTMTKAPLGAEAVGANPTDRAKTGTKRSLLTDGAGVLLAVVGDGANRHDSKRVEATLNSVQAIPPDPATEQNLCLDKGFDYPHVEQLVRDYAYHPHIRSRGEEARDLAELPGYRARRWVVERTHSWMNRFRRLLTRWEKKKANFLSLIHLACAYITFRAAGVLG